MDELLRSAARRSIKYLNNLDHRNVAPSFEALSRLKELDHPLPEEPTAAEIVLATLDDIGSPATVASAGGWYFGFVTGGSLPITLAANWLAGAWDQAADMVVASPIGAKLEEVAIRWLLDILCLPENAGVGFVTGATVANFAGLASARHAILQKAGWDVESYGLFGAPEISVIVGDEVHVSILKALNMLGFGHRRVIRVPVDDQGKMRVDAIPALTERSIICIQAGNVNTGAFDSAEEICALAQQSGAWVHADGAFGLWAIAAPARAHLAVGMKEADSWALDAHKWLNVPYDSGIVICRQEEHLRAAMGFIKAAYLSQSDQREPGMYTPEMSRRARGVEVWAALRSLGRVGLSDLIERCCWYASQFARGLSAAGYQILNDVVLNQVLVSFGDDETNQKVIACLQEDGTCWCGGTRWHGRTVMRISVSCWATTENDVKQSLETMLKIAAKFAKT